MSERLEGAQFRWINELLYNSTGKKALKYVRENPKEFGEYHTAYNRITSENWPNSPLRHIITSLKSDIMLNDRNNLVIADFGCGDAKLAQFLEKETKGKGKGKGKRSRKSLENRSIKVHSFDLHALNSYVEACDMSSVPLKDGSVDVAVFCLSLMGTNYCEYLKEAHRVLLGNGLLKIAEVRSRILSLNRFKTLLHRLGFDVLDVGVKNSHFLFFDAIKSPNRNCRPLWDDFVPSQVLAPCVYKKR